MRTRKSLKIPVLIVALSLLWCPRVTPAYGQNWMADWEKIGSPAEDLYALGDSLYATDSAGKISKRSGNPLIKPKPSEEWKQWDIVTGKGAEFAIQKDMLFRLATDKSAVHFLEWKADPEGGIDVPGGITGSWKANKIRGATDHIYGGEFGLFATDPGTATTTPIYRLVGDFKNPTWQLIGSGKAKTFAVGKSHLYGVRGDGKGVNQFDGTGWKALDKPQDLQSVDVIYAGGDALYATRWKQPYVETDNIYQYNTSDNSWKYVGGPGKQFAVDGEGRLYGLSPVGTANEGVQARIGGSWKQVYGPAAKLSAAGNQLVYITDAATKNVYIFKPRGDLEIVDWCYDLAGSDIKFSLRIRNNGPFVWNGPVHSGVKYLMFVTYNDGIIHEHHPEGEDNLTDLKPGEEIAIGSHALPFSENFTYYVSLMKINHDDDTNATNNTFIPPKQEMEYGMPGKDFTKGGNLYETKRCNTP